MHVHFQLRDGALIFVGRGVGLGHSQVEGCGYVMGRWRGGAM